MTKAKKTCVWLHTGAFDNYHVGCHGFFISMQRTAYKYCPFCGKPITERKSK